MSLGALMFGPWGNPDENECVRIVEEALEAGVNLIDTADIYSGGISEEIVGRAVRSRRDQVILATKVHGQMGPGPNTGGNSRLWIMREVENSLRRLGTDYIDLYQLHRPDPNTHLEETLGALSDLQEAGKILYAGSSNFPAWMVVEAQCISERRAFLRLASEQAQYSLFVRAIETELLPVAQRYDIGLLTWSPLAGGWLTGKYQEGAPVPTESRAMRIRNRPEWSRFDPNRLETHKKYDLLTQFSRVASDAGLTLLETAYGFVLSNPAVTSVVIGPRTLSQLREALAAADTRLDGSMLQAIDRHMPPGAVVGEYDRPKPGP